ncbi:peptidoglycan-binding protein [Streptomyces sp. NPDC050803]|uniref:peptidoglycan-binding protein n=1 Tax=unclassified Streptomyces TaxID=2593676 RepID=UPI00343463C8
MPDVEIDTSRLTVASFTVPEAGIGPVDGSVSPPPTVSLPAPGTYHLLQGDGPVSDLAFTVAADGTLDFDAALDAVAEGRGTRRLTVRGLPVRLDGTALDHGLILPGSDTVLAGDRPHDLSLLPCAGHRLDGGTGTLVFALRIDGVVQLPEGTADFVTASGNSLTVRGRTVRIDGTALSHDLLPLGLAGPQQALPRATVNVLTVLPGDGYGFAAGPDLVTDVRFGVEADGQVTVGFEYSGFASAEGDTVILRGYPVVLDTSAADSDLVGLGNIATDTPGPPPLRRGPREMLFVLLPARRYLPQTANGVLETGFAVERDGTLTFPSLVAGRYGVVSPTVPNPSQEGEEFTVEAVVRPTDADAGAPGGTVTFSLVDGQVLGTAPLDDRGRARLTTAALPPGDHVIVVDYAGGDVFAPGVATIRHRVEARRSLPAADASLPEVLEWALLPTLAFMTDPQAVDGHVKLAQALLNAAGAALPPLVVDGNFGVLTQAAVRGFRTGALLPPGEVVDTPAWFALALAAPFPLLEPGPRTPPMTGPPVALVQGLLNRAGAMPPLDTDGKYGPLTGSAVRAFQSSRALTVTGTVTPETWAALAVSPPTPVPARAATMRLTFSYDSADWAEGGPLVRFVSREDLDATPPLADDPDDSPQGRSGFWYEVRDGRGQVLYRRSRYRPIEILPEVRGEGGEGMPGRVPVDAPHGTFELLAPVLPGATVVVLFSSPPDPARLNEPAAEIFSLPLAQ